MKRGPVRGDGSHRTTARAEDGQRPDGEIRVEGLPMRRDRSGRTCGPRREADQELEEYYAQEDAERKRQEAALSQ